MLPCWYTEGGGWSPVVRPVAWAHLIPFSSFADVEVEPVKADPDHVWLVEHPEVLEKHVGQWIAVKDGRVLAAGRDFRRVAAEAKKIAADPLFQKVPEPADLVYPCLR